MVMSGFLPKFGREITPKKSFFDFENSRAGEMLKNQAFPSEKVARGRAEIRPGGVPRRRIRQSADLSARPASLGHSARLLQVLQRGSGPLRHSPQTGRTDALLARDLGEWRDLKGMS